MQYEVVTAEAPLGEGPVWCPDGTLVITQISPGGLRRIDPTSGKSETFVSFLGGGNSAQLASDGGFVVCNNGCIDFTGFAGALGLDGCIQAAKGFPAQPDQIGGPGIAHGCQGVFGGGDQRGQPAGGRNRPHQTAGADARDSAQTGARPARGGGGEGEGHVGTGCQGQGDSGGQEKREKREVDHGRLRSGFRHYDAIPPPWRAGSVGRDAGEDMERVVLDQAP